jgi:ubiquinone/menaquinone biosynthesis C-methylase UbiE
MENQHVHAVYEKIASKFDHTRFSYWKAVREFLDNIPKHSIVADVGTGNGKYLTYRNDITVIGNDMCDNLLNIISLKNDKANICRANALCLPYRNLLFDATISIAVLHHISTFKDRCKFIEEIIRILIPSGECLITVWAREQPIKPNWKDLGNNDFFIPWVDKDEIHNRFYHLFTYGEVLALFSQYHEIIDIISIKFEMNNWCVQIVKKENTIP